MPRPGKGPHLYPRRRKGRATIYVIRDGEREVSTKCGLECRADAERRLQDYIAEKYTPPRGIRDPDQIMIADAFTYYARIRAPSLADAARIATAFGNLLPFWGAMSVADIDDATSRAYVDRRTNGDGKAIGTVRRELEAMQAAIAFYCKSHLRLKFVPYVPMPDKPPPRDRWMTDSQFARLVETAEAMPEAGPHLALFMRIGFFTGTRRDAILALQWQPNRTGGWIDLEAGRVYRLPEGQAETSKRRPPCPVPVPLMPHLIAARKRTENHVIEWRGKPVGSIKKSFKRATELAGVPWVTPHVLRHTCGTRMAQHGVPSWIAGGHMGVSATEFERTYAHHDPNFMGAATDSFSDFGDKSIASASSFEDVAGAYSGRGTK